LDKHPINVGHVLIVPRYHVEAFYELDEQSFIELMLVVKGLLLSTPFISLEKLECLPQALMWHMLTYMFCQCMITTI
jgi:hypothetical protein